MLPDAEIQVPFLADLVTLADPTSPLLVPELPARQGRLYRFYFHERFHVLRREFEAYCRWVAEQLSSRAASAHRVDAIRPRRGRLVGVGARASSTAPSTSCSASAACRRCRSSRAGSTHSSGLPARARAGAGRGLGGGDRLRPERGGDLRRPARARPRRALDWFTRSAGFLPMEYSKLGLEHFSPEYTAYFHALPEDTARRAAGRPGPALQGHRRRRPASASTTCSTARSIDGASRTCATPRAASCAASTAASGCSFHQLDQDVDFTHEADVAILPRATSRRRCRSRGTCWRATRAGRPVVELDYRLRLADGSPSTLFVQNGELHTHGVGAPDLGLGAHRNAVIVNALAGREVYAVRERNVFQSFGPPQSTARDRSAA